MHRAVALVCLWATAAHADSAVALHRSELAIDVTIEVNLAHHYLGEPFSLAPDLWWGATDRLTLGVTHSHASVDRFEPGGSLCVTTDPLYCDSAYRGSGLDARLQLVDGPVEIAPRVRALLVDVGPVKTAFTLGALARWRRGTIAVVTDPYLQAGVAGVTRGNRSAIVVPVELAITVGRRVDLSLHSGFISQLAALDGGWHIPVAAGARVALTPALELGATLGFASLLGPQNTPKQRALFVSVGWRGGT